MVLMKQEHHEKFILSTSLKQQKKASADTSMFQKLTLFNGWNGNVLPEEASLTPSPPKKK